MRQQVPAPEAIGWSEEVGTIMENQDLVQRYVEKNPHRPGTANARIVGYGVPVWALIAQLDAVGGSVDRVAEGYAVPREAVLAALAYYRRHKSTIDARIAANAA